MAAANSQQVTFTLKYTDNQNNSQTTTAQATFNIAGPTSPNITTTTGQVVINPGPSLAFGNNPPNIGITFSASANPPSGFSNNFVWVQLITANTITLKGSSGTWTCAQSPNASGLDTEYPYATGTSTNDNPDFSLSTSYSAQITGINEVIDNPFQATMYLLWRPGLTNDIPVPLGSVGWRWSGDATYNASNQTWSLASGSGTASAFQSSGSYPSWSGSVPFTGVSCHL